MLGRPKKRSRCTKNGPVFKRIGDALRGLWQQIEAARAPVADLRGAPDDFPLALEDDEDPEARHVWIAHLRSKPEAERLVALLRTAQFRAYVRRDLNQLFAVEVPPEYEEEASDVVRAQYPCPSDMEADDECPGCSARVVMPIEETIHRWHCVMCGTIWG